MKYTLGLDLGTTSVGWAVVDNENKKIVDLGVRIFESAENPKDGKSLAEPRRIARSMRRRLARRGYRLDKIKSIFIHHGLLTTEKIAQIHVSPNNPYQIRAEGLDRVLTDEELFIAVYHLAKHRGYKSNRKKVLEDKEKEGDAKKVLSGIKENEKLLQATGSRTVGEMLYKEFSVNKSKADFSGLRNKPGTYKHSVSREMLESELITIFTAQKKLGNSTVATLEKELLDAFSFQRHYAQGEILKEMVGACTFESGEIRAAKATFSFQYFNLLQKINHLVINPLSERRVLTSEEREKVIANALEKKDVNYGQIKKWLKLNPEDRFNIVYAISKKDVESGERVEDLFAAYEAKTKFVSMADIYTLLKTVREADEQFYARIENNTVVLDQIAEILTLYKTDEDILKYVRKITVDGAQNSFPKAVEDALLSLSFTKFGNLSLKSLRKIIPYLETGLTYDKAIEKAYPDQLYKVTARAKKLKPIDKDDHSITNPVVRRTIAQTIKVVNAVIDTFGSPFEVHIELARELSKNRKERNDITKSQATNRARNEQAVENIKAKGVVDPSGRDIVRYKLWKEQNCQCAYSGNPIDENRIFEDGYTQIDHIIPFSRSFDDGYNNKVLVLTSENQDKLNKLPYEVFGHDEDRWQEFSNRVEAMLVPLRKKRNLLLKKYVADELTERTLNDTRYLSKYLKNYIEKTLEFAEGEKKRRVVTVNGAATAYLRSRWGMNKNRQETDTHHAQDAAVVAVIGEKLVKEVAFDSRIGNVRRYLKKHKNIQDQDVSTEEVALAEKLKKTRSTHSNSRFPEPWEGFTDELEKELSKVFVSRMPRRKTTGQVHDATLRSPKLFSEEKSSVRKPLSAIKEKEIIENRSHIDPGIYDRLLAQLREHGGDSKKAFAEPFYKIQKDGSRGPVVRTLKITKSGQKSGVFINDGKALVENPSMIRIDIFSKKGKKGKDEYYFIPIYVHHKTQKQLPNKVVVRKKESEWKVIDDSYVFKFSLYPGDLFKTKKGEEEKYWYYVSASISTASLTAESHDRSESIGSMGIKTLDNIDKYVVDVLGNYHRVGKEKRQNFH